MLRLGQGDVFEGEGILAVTKGLLQAGVSYVTGYQGAPVSQLMDVLADASEILEDLGVSYVPAVNEAGAASALGASVRYPMRGAAVWKSTAGTNVAADALSNLSSAGVSGGAVIILGEDYGEGSSIIQERSHAFAMKSQMWLFDPRPDHQRLVDGIEEAFELSEASRTPVMFEMRIRACHMTGRFTSKDNKRPVHSAQNKVQTADRNSDQIVVPPFTYNQERDKLKFRLPDAIKFIRERGINERFDGTSSDVGIICQGGLYNGVVRGLQELELADLFGESKVSILALNVTYPLVPDEILNFCRGKRAVLIVEEGAPAFLEQAIGALLRQENVTTAIVGKQVLPEIGEYTTGVVALGVARFLEGAVPADIELQKLSAYIASIKDVGTSVAKLLEVPLPKRPAGLCTGCPERPVFTALKLLERDVGKVHIAADIGCHSFATLPPFDLGHSVLGYGLSLSSVSGLAPASQNRVISVMGDGGFWHNGINTGVIGALQNKQDSILIVLENGYTSATGQQYLPSSLTGANSAGATNIEKVLISLGVPWVRRLSSYSIGNTLKSLREAFHSKTPGLKVIIAEGECQIARQRRKKPMDRAAIEAGNRLVQSRFGVDESTCTGDHSCIRLSGCPSLTVKESRDPLRVDPVAHVNNDCVGCGVCGEVSDAAALCPSFYRVDITRNAGFFERGLHWLRMTVISSLQTSAAQ